MLKNELVLVKAFPQFLFGALYSDSGRRRRNATNAQLKAVRLRQPLFQTSSALHGAWNPTILREMVRPSFLGMVKCESNVHRI